MKFKRQHCITKRQNRNKDNRGIVISYYLLHGQTRNLWTVSQRSSRSLSKSFNRHAARSLFNKSRYCSSHENLEKQTGLRLFKFNRISLLVNKQTSAQSRSTITPALSGFWPKRHAMGHAGKLTLKTLTLRTLLLTRVFCWTVPKQVMNIDCRNCSIINLGQNFGLNT